ncbi:MAG: hypothetical protein WA901_06835, partial [Phormidesmis sp.]
MATLHGNWLPDLQRFFLWGETWQKAQPVAVEDLLATSEIPTLAKQPYQLSQAALAASFQKGNELDLSWMQTVVQAKSSRSKSTGAKGSGEKGPGAKGTGEKGPGGKSAAKSSIKGARQPKSWQSRGIVLPSKLDEKGVLPTLSADAEGPSSVLLYPW